MNSEMRESIAGSRNARETTQRTEHGSPYAAPLRWLVSLAAGSASAAADARAWFWGASPTRAIALVLVVCWAVRFVDAAPLGTAFNYQGRLTDSGQPANGSYDLKFTLFDAASSGATIAGPITNSTVGISNGLFSLTLDFGSAFDGTARWLEMGVRTNGGGDFTLLSPRVRLLPGPAAIYASNAGAAATAASATSAGSATNFTAPLTGDVIGTQTATLVARVGGQPAGGIANGAIAANAATSVNTPGAIVKRDSAGGFRAGAITATDLAGNGAGLTNLSAASLTGTVADARLSTNVSLLNANQSFPGSNTFSGVLQATNVNNRLGGTLTGALVGNVTGNLSGNVTGNVSGSASSFAGPLAGDVTGTQGATVVSKVGGVSAGNVAAGANAANAAASGNTRGAIVLRDGSGNFVASTITAAFAGNGAALTNLNAANLAGTVADARLSTNVSLLNANQRFLGSNTFNGVLQATNADNRLNGTLTGTLVGNVSGNITGNVTGNVSGNVTGNVSGSASGFTGSLAGDVTGAQGATVVSRVGGMNAGYVAAGANAANAATSVNSPGAIVQRDGSGNFAAGTITAAFAGNGAALTSLNAANLTGTLADARLSANVALLNANQTFAGSNTFQGATLFTNAANTFVGAFVGDGLGLTNLNVTGASLGGTPLAGDVTGRVGAAVVSTVAGVSAANVASGANAGNAATSANIASTLVKRDAGGGFAAGTITAAYIGDGAGLTNLTAAALVGTAASATRFTAPLVGDVTGAQGATVVSAVGGLTAAQVATGANAANAATNINTPGTLVRREECDGNFIAGTITARFVGDGSGLTNLPTSPNQYGAPLGAVLASVVAQDAGLIASGYRQIMSFPSPAWVNGATANAPASRAGHTAIWDGQQMIIWGGSVGAGAYSASGGIYDPNADAWAAVSTIGAPSARGGHTAVWSGTRMIVWGGQGSSGDLGTGGSFAPGAQTWSSVATNGAPPARNGHVAVWTGSRMLIWGGLNRWGLLNDGALYDPSVNQWTALAIPNPPAPRMGATAVWAGDRFIVWGGQGASGELDTGGQLLFSNGAPASWVSLPLSGAPFARSGHSAVWANDRMIVWGGQNAGVVLGDGAAYCPSCEQWKTVSTANAPAPRSEHASVWTGTEMLILDGANAAGDLAASAAYDPVTQEWRALSGIGGPLARTKPAVAWTGTEVMIFGGKSGGQPVGSLQRLSPQPAWHFYRKL